MMIDNELKANKFSNTGKLYYILLILIVAVSLIFLALYHKFIFSDCWYAYLDTARDTVDQYIPREIFEINNYWNGELNQYTLQFGLGANYVFPWYKYFNPVNLPLLLLEQQNLRVALITSLYLKYLFIALFGWLFFRRLIEDERIAAICALLWTYSGYNVLWGQHYGFLTSMLGFTVFLCGLQLILDDCKRWYLAPLLFFPLASGAYAFFYQACVFSIVYGIVYVIIKKDDAKTAFKKLIVFAVSILISVVLAAEYIALSAEGFLASSRMGNVVSVSTNGFYPIKNIVAIIARFFSNDMLGVASSSYYPGNYYEIAAIAVGTLSVLALFWLMQSKYKLRTLLITAVSAICLCLPIVSHILLFKATTQRWTFIICLIEVIMIGFAIKNLIEAVQDNQGNHMGDVTKKAIRTFAFSDVFLCVALLLLFLLQSRYGYRISKWSVVIVLCSYIMYHVAALVICFSIKKALSKSAVWICGILFVCCALEMFVMNYRCVNSRKIVAADAWENSIYNDGTVEVVKQIQEEDNGLYRINKTYDSKYYNDAMVQDYYGVGSYYSLNSQNLIYAYAALGNYVYENTDTLTGTNYIRFPGDDITDNMLLAVKYVVSNGDELPGAFYEKLFEEGDKTAYRNRFWNGFGTLYTRVIDDEGFFELSEEERRAVVSEAAVTGDSEELVKAMGLNEAMKLDEAALLKSDAALVESLQTLNDNGFVDIQEGVNKFSGTVHNKTKGAAILCIPLIYEKHWNAKVDGQDVKVYKINGGLVGVIVETGEHSLELTYSNNTAIVGRIIGIIFVVGYVVMLIMCRKKLLTNQLAE